MIWTIGHSTRQPDEFLALLARHDIEGIVDVRRHPGSRRHPQFGQAALESLLTARGLQYHWIEALGGRRRAAGAAQNAWRNASFAAYADYIGTREFAAGLDELLEHARRTRTAILCAELLWWRCHRRIIADVLTFRGIEVTHILDESHASTHSLAPPAHVVDGRLSYAA